MRRCALVTPFDDVITPDMITWLIWSTYRSSRSRL